jgi:hypothetical protein
MSLEQDLLADKDSVSLDFDPPAYSQPTLPPPPVTSSAAPVWSARWGPRFVGAGLVALAGVTAGAYALLPHGATTGEAAAATAPVTVTARLDQLISAFPDQLPEKVCTASKDRIPLVLYSAVEGLHTGSPPPTSELRMFVGAVPVTDATLVIAARRVAVLRTIELREPLASLGEPMPGRYEGAIVVFDASTNTPLCHTVVRTWSSSEVAQPKVSARLLNDDFITRVRGAMGEGATRLKVELDL